MKQQQITIKDIALEVGMSTSTVSRALSDHEHISEETKARVNEAVQKLGYRYNALAAALRNSKSNTIGLIVPRISMFFQAAVITAIQNTLHKYGYSVIICQSNEDPEQEKKLVNLLHGSRVEGIIVSCSIKTEDFTHFDNSLQGEIPIIFYDRVPNNYPAHKIKGDEYHGAYLSTLHLIEQGCKRIAHIGGPLSCNQYQERFDGYKDALKKGNVPFENDLAFFHELNKENALHTCAHIFDQEVVPDGIFASNDTTALAIVEFAKKRNIAVPDSLKVVGYSNDNRTDISFPTITSIEQFPHEMGEQAANLMMDLIQKRVNPGRSFISLTTPVELIKRGSSGF
ncbi:MAG: LacI family DNA-binding transcriptional regulator [Candidatus Pedobacter colombiensis]|uniref:LacI family DNA-binding transcriptional regulator n=1 Tax=Candidatus Pedobacter colombiensis TaxID=3121371 RepID=A0AAJ6B7U3_9SPHI|nr:LacI family DNA-binding transcriptional regulator [Pedobacter sp.]WEK20239.1 MAG: LacI family DNA-binding transcriptional regulator [Pedobacter sp.]